MQIIKEFTISGMYVQNSVDVPIQLILGGDELAGESSIRLDEKTFTRLGFTLETNLVKCVLRCVLDGRRLPSYADRNFLNPDDVLICALERVEKDSYHPWNGICSKFGKVVHSMSLSTYDPGAGTFHKPPCPEYKLQIALTPDEYVMFKGCASKTIMNVRLQLL